MKNKVKKYLVNIFKTISIFLALIINEKSVVLLDSNKIGELIGNSKNTINYSVIIIIIYIVITKIFNKYEIKKSIKYTSIIFAITMYLSKAINIYGFIFPIINISTYVFLFLYSIGWYYIFSNILFILISLVKKISAIKIKKTITDISNKKFVFICMMIIIICWLPYIITRYPAGMCYDARHQILEYYGINRIRDHWPYFSTLLIGWFVDIGKNIFSSYNVGAFLYVIFETILSSFILSYSLLFIKKYLGNSMIILVLLLLYSIVPIFPGYLTSIIKDGLFSIFVLFYIVLLAECLKYNYKKRYLFALISLLVCLLRKNGIFIVIFSVFSLLIIMIRNKKKIYYELFVLLCVVIVLYSIYENVFIPLLGVEKGSIAEALSIPFQQTARYMKYYQNEVTSYEYKTISSILDINVVINDYNPLSSDPIKATYHGTSKDLLSYLLVWAKMFFKHPLVYIEATINNCLGFFDITAKMPDSLNSGFYMNCNIESLKVQLFSNDNILNNYKYYIYSFIQMWESMPLIGLTCSIALPSFFAIYLLFDGIQEKNVNSILIIVPIITSILVLVASPTWLNEFRYALPIVYSIPFLFVYLENIKCKE